MKLRNSTDPGLIGRDHALSFNESLSLAQPYGPWSHTSWECSVLGGFFGGVGGRGLDRHGVPIGVENAERQRLRGGDLHLDVLVSRPAQAVVVHKRIFVAGLDEWERKWLG